MSDSLIPPSLILMDIAFGYFGWRNVRKTLAKPGGEFRRDPLFAPKSKLRISLLRITEMLDTITFLAMGAAVVIVAIIGLIKYWSRPWQTRKTGRGGLSRESAPSDFSCAGRSL